VGWGRVKGVEGDGEGEGEGEGESGGSEERAHGT